MHLYKNGPWDKLEEVARLRDDNGKRLLVPIVGSGFNNQAQSKLENGKKQDSWDNLLGEVALDIGVNVKHLLCMKKKSNISVWEQIIVRMAGSQNVQANKCEEELQKSVQKILMENRRIKSDYYKKFIGYGFRDIVSLNFDLELRGSRRIHLKLNTEERFGLPEDAEPLYRVANNFGTRIWYPHGDIQKYKTIKLGVRKYGVYCKYIDNSVSKFKAQDKSKKIGDKLKKLEEALNQYSKHDQFSWVTLVMSSPLVFLGCGLTNDEWPILWALHQRNRNKARIKCDLAPGFILTNKVEDAVRFESLGLIPLCCNSWEEGWGRIDSILE